MLLLAGTQSTEQPGILWIGKDTTSPHPYLTASFRKAGTQVRSVYWDDLGDGQRPLSRLVPFGRRTAGSDYRLTVHLISPRLLLELIRAPEDVAIMFELGLVGFYACLSKVFRRRRLVSLVEGDYGYLGRRGTAAFKVILRKLVARFIDVFVANNELARQYLIHTLKVPPEKIVVGWWLTGLPSDMESRMPPDATPVPDGVPLFVCASQLIPRKGIDLLLESIAIYRQETGPCMLWVFGDGPERDSLAALARRLQIEESVVFFGQVSHECLKGALQACDALVFPTLRDLTGRVVVEALSVGTPVVLSPMTGAAGTIVYDDMNGLIADPRDSSAFAVALARFADPKTAYRLREGVQRTNMPLNPDVGAEVILRAVELARSRLCAPCPATSAANQVRH